MEVVFALLEALIGRILETKVAEVLGGRPALVGVQLSVVHALCPWQRGARPRGAPPLCLSRLERVLAGPCPSRVVLLDVYP